MFGERMKLFGRKPSARGRIRLYRDWVAAFDRQRKSQVLQLSRRHLASVFGRLLLIRMERETGVEPATCTLARCRSTTEPLPLNHGMDYSTACFGLQIGQL